MPLVFDEENNSSINSGGSGNTGGAFTIIYPNSGTEENPANIEANKRYVMDNPYPNKPVLVVAELLVDGIWGDPNTIYSSYTGTDGGYGTKAHHVLESDEIIVQTGRRAVANMRASDTLGAHGSTAATNLASAPCRVKVWRL